MGRSSLLRQAAALAAVAMLVCCAVPATSTESSQKIKHLVVLMLENRSFDHMLGLMKANSSEITGCTVDDPNPRCSNPVDPTVPDSPTVHLGNRAVYIQPADPSHSNSATMQQIYGFGNVTNNPPPMTGFIKSYASDNSKAHGGGEFIMEAFQPSHVPVITTLGSEFAVLDHWFCGLPGPTEVNRAFANSGTSYGFAGNQQIFHNLGLPEKTIWETLANAGKDWRVYFEDFPSTLLFQYTWGHLDHFKGYQDFAADVAKGDLPEYTWLEPRYYEDFGKAARDQHPDHDVAQGEMMMKEVYDALRNSPIWNETALLITYDEHGGFFDHVSPPTGVPNPDGRVSVHPPFNFTQLGVRVPAVLVSPWIDANTVVHMPAAGEGGAFCHSSIPATVRKLFAPDEPFLTKRDAWAATFDTVLSRTTPRTDCPTSMPTPPLHRDVPEFGRLPELDGNMPVSDLQRGFLLDMAAMVGDASINDEAIDAMTEGEAGRYITRLVNAVAGRTIVNVDGSTSSPPVEQA